MTLKQLVDEYQSEVIGPSILSEVTRVAMRITRGYDPHVYASAPSWDDAIEDLVHDIVVDQLLGERQLDYIMITARDLQHFRALLTRQSKRALAHRRRRTVVDNLLDRARPILERPPFERIGPRRYRLTGTATEDRQPSDRELYEAAIAVMPIPKIVPAATERAPVVYHDRDLRLLVTGVARALPTPLEVADLDRVLRHLLTPWTSGLLVSIEEAVQVSSPEAGPSEELEADEVADRIIRKLGREERDVLAFKYIGLSDQEVSGRINRSRPTVAERRATAIRVIREEVEGLDGAARDLVVARLGARLVSARVAE